MIAFFPQKIYKLWGQLHKICFQKLLILSLSGEYGIFGTDVHMLLPHEWANLTSLSLQELTRDGYMSLMSVISQRSIEQFSTVAFDNKF